MRLGFIGDILRWALDLIYSLVGNYGWAVLIFTLLIRLVLMPLDIKSRKSMIAMQRVQPTWIARFHEVLDVVVVEDIHLQVTVDRLEEHLDHVRHDGRAAHSTEDDAREVTGCQPLQEIGRDAGQVVLVELGEPRAILLCQELLVALETRSHE